ncbi:hypothetical protein EXU57_18955 [Segetibacter sp. 3557_3]|uniref:hypothetical protein n=1 Tax=Segetibacter sp. 3557_3 TaxID=2547429 RepID=UPI0010586F79|nr:hypothetical protein [Segetibacter sp. 3557_3]TDH21587.1 hypothetical protein EXU57_18955 [Segetibacter sp. 3557_3]
MNVAAAILLFTLIMLTSCSAVKETSDYRLKGGLYKITEKGKQRYYASVGETSINFQPVSRSSNGIIKVNDTMPAMIFPSIQNAAKRTTIFSQKSLDLDVISIVFKYRPSRSGFPGQLNTNFNAAGYIGHRRDLSVFSYERNPVGMYDRRIAHFAYSLGFFGGLGSTAINPFVTRDPQAPEYDGLVITKGLASLIGIGNLTFGLAVGIDHLADQYRRQWLYQSKLWTGFTVGLNLN